jgi:hypothetical protein
MEKIINNIKLKETTTKVTNTIQCTTRRWSSIEIPTFI